MTSLKMIVVGTAAAACMVGAHNASAGQVVGFSSDTGAGGVTSFDWDGGDAGGFGTAGTLRAAMNYAADKGGGTNFDGAGFKATKVNMFLVDFSTDGSGTYSDAGLTLFVMWGNHKDPGGDFIAEVDISPLIDQGDDGSFTSGVSEIFALGPGVTIEVGGITVDVDVNSESTPIGYAITNITDYPSGIVNEQFTLAGAIKAMAMYGFGQGKVWDGVDDDGDGQIFTDGIVLTVIPAPPAALWGLAGLGGIAFAARRRSIKG